MQKKLLLSVLAIALLIGGAVFIWSKQQKTKDSVVSQVQNQKEDVRNNENMPHFVTDIDPDVNHWQTKETEFFTIKFPKEWYWIEATPPAPQYGRSSIITNNPNHPLQYPDHGMFDDVVNNTEVVITNNGSATSDAGTPVDSLNSLIKSAEERNAKCVRLSESSIPLIASCVEKDQNHQMYHSYYIINEITSLFLTAHTSDNTIISEEILERIARNLKMKK